MSTPAVVAFVGAAVVGGALGGALGVTFGPVVLGLWYGWRFRRRASRVGLSAEERTPAERPTLEHAGNLHDSQACPPIARR